ncbi:MAG: hypothetical protein JXR64_12355 [Spirochaetales bacterium]|nr:hypothetical protein [Spirochaetales bacterium]
MTLELTLLRRAAQLNLINILGLQIFNKSSFDGLFFKVQEIVSLIDKKKELVPLQTLHPCSFLTFYY